MLNKSVISNDTVTVFKACAKRTLADVNCYCKMMTVVALDGVTSFLHIKNVTYSCEGMRNSPTFGRISSVQWQKVGRS